MDDVRNSDFVYTFNCSLGWKALIAGIPCMSDPSNSLLGYYFNHILLDNISEQQDIERRNILAIMSNLQLTLSEIREGNLWPLLKKLLSGSDMIVAKP